MNRRSHSKRGNKKTKPRATRRAAGKSFVFEREGGPRKWLIPILESAYSKLEPRDKAAAQRKTKTPQPKGPAGQVPYRSRLQPGRGEDVLSSISPNFWVDTLKEYKRRKSAAVAARAAVVRPPGAPAVPGQVNWAPLGPAELLNGQAQGLPAVGGRVGGIAIAPGGQIIYAASANGGVFRSDNGGQSWRSLMDRFDVDPTSFASTCLACGAIAIDSQSPDRVYVGTGEGDTYAIFSSRILNALPAYRGIGPVRSDDGGQTWVVENTAAGSPGLAGQAFFALAVDPRNRENVVGATSGGLYQRASQAGGAAQWTQRMPGVFSSAVVCSAGNVTRFFAAKWGAGVFQSTDGSNWLPVGTGFPSANVGRIALGVQSTNPNLIYAAVADPNGLLLGVYCLNGVAGAWTAIGSPPAVLPADNGASQGDYDLAIAIDPSDASLLYLGGSYYADQQYWPASIWRCRVQSSGASLSFSSSDSIGQQAHADVHILTHSPGDSNALWVGCDGGVFLNQDPVNSANFASRNNGLSCLCSTFLGQHPTDPAILFCGFQDNGTGCTNGSPSWNHVCGGDGGYCAINWADPTQVIVFANGTVYRATDGGQNETSWTPKQFPWAMMTEPIVQAPYNPASPSDAKIVALGSAKQTAGGGFQRVVYLSSDFGATWPTVIPIPTANPTAGGIYSMAFASVSRFFVGTAAGEVFRVDQSGNTWKTTRLDQAAAGPLGLTGLISDIAIDWADAGLASIYVTFGGVGDNRRVWHFDGTRWEVRSGTANGANGSLLNVEHNAIIVDRAAPSNVYAGADIGVWHSADAGQSWQPLSNGLPDAPVFDVQIHPSRRLLRASTHGRGLYEIPL